jgi:hypothetical protein
MTSNKRNGLWCSTILSSALISACTGGGGIDTTERLGKFDPELPPELYCAGLCGDGECIAFSGEDCGNCLQDCGVASACMPNGTATFAPGAASLTLGASLENGCIPNVAVTTRDRGVIDGAAPLPFKEGATRLLTAPPGCGGIGDEEPTAGEGVSLRDGTLGVNFTCLRVGPNAQGAPLGVGLRYETGRWRSPDPVGRPGDHLRPGASDVGDFWFVSYSRRPARSIPRVQRRAVGRRRATGQLHALPRGLHQLHLQPQRGHDAVCPARDDRQQRGRVREDRRRERLQRVVLRRVRPAADRAQRHPHRLPRR